MYQQLKEKLTPQHLRTFTFLLAVVLYTASYLLYPKGSYQGQISGFINIIGFLFLTITFNYQKKEDPIKIYRWLEAKMQGNPVRGYTALAILLTILSVIGIFIAYLIHSKQGYMSRANYGFQIVLVFVLYMTFSAWERRYVVKQKK